MTNLLPEDRKLKEVKPEHPMAGNKHAQKPPELRLDDRIYIDVTANNHDDIRKAAKICGQKVQPWLRGIIVGTTKRIIDGEMDSKAADNLKLSDDAKNAIVWLTCSPAAKDLTCREARQEIRKIFGEQVDDELRRFFSI